MLVMLGAGFTAIVLAVAHDRVLSEFAGTLRTIACTLSHGFDSCGWWSSGGWNTTRAVQCRARLPQRNERRSMQAPRRCRNWWLLIGGRCCRRLFTERSIAHL